MKLTENTHKLINFNVCATPIETIYLDDKRIYDRHVTYNLFVNYCKIFFFYLEY